MHVYRALLSNLATYRKRRRTCRQTKSSFNQATKSMHPKTSCHKVHNVLFQAVSCLLDENIFIAS